MATRDKRDVESALLSKGFRESKSTHHRRLVYYQTTGQKVPQINTRTSEGRRPKSLGDDLLAQMAGQCRLDATRQFLDLVDCPMTQLAFENHLRTKGLIP